MGHFLVTFQRQLACGVLSNSTTLVTGGILNVVFFVFVFVKTVQAQRLAARGQLHHKNAMVLPIYDKFLRGLCVALALRSVLFLVFKGQSSEFNLFEWVIVNPVVAPLRDGVAVFTWQRSGGVDAVRRTIVFAVLWWLVQGCIGLNYWLAQASDPTQGPVAESAYWAVHGGIIMVLHLCLCASAALSRWRSRRAAASRSPSSKGTASTARPFRDSVLPYSAFIFLTFLLFFFTLLSAFPASLTGCWYSVVYLCYYCAFPVMAYLCLKMDSGYWRGIGVRLSHEAMSTAAGRNGGSLVIDFSRVEFGTEIARGATAHVCRAVLDARTAVAVKKYTCTTLTEADAQSYIREVSVLAGLRHPNVVALYGVVIQPPYMCLVVELMHNGSLFDVLGFQLDAEREADAQAAAAAARAGLDSTSAVVEVGNPLDTPLLHQAGTVAAPRVADVVPAAAGPLTPLLRLQLLHDAWTGLAFLHARDPPVLHGDIKSLNLLISKDWVMKLCDFGESRLRVGAALPAGSNQVADRTARAQHHAGGDGGWGKRSVSTAAPGAREEAGVARLAELTALHPAFRVVQRDSAGRAAPRVPGGADASSGGALRVPETVSEGSGGVGGGVLGARAGVGAGGAGAGGGTGAATIVAKRKPRGAFLTAHGVPSRASSGTSISSDARVPSGRVPSTSTGALLSRGRARRGASASLRVSKAGAELDTSSGAQFKATPQWTAPEAFGGRRYTAASDVFSMALVMWEMWALVPPFSGVAPHEVPTVIISGRRPPIPAGMPRAVAALVQQCWSHHTVARPTAASVARALEAIIQAHASSRAAP